MPDYYHAPLSDLIDAHSIPGDIAFLENGAEALIQDLLGGIFYKDLHTETSPEGDRRIYSLTLVTKSLRQSLGSSGLALVLFRGAEADYAEIPVYFEWQWPVQKYIRGFEQEGFSYAPEAFIDILLSMAGISDAGEFIDRIIEVFLDQGDDYWDRFMNEAILAVQSKDDGRPVVTDVINDIITNLQLIKETVKSHLNASNHLSLYDLFRQYKDIPELADPVIAINASIDILRKELDLSFSLVSELVKILLKLGDSVEAKFEQLKLLFAYWLGEINWEDIKYLLIPQFSIGLGKTAVALELPRSVLLPMKNTGSGWVVDEDITHNAAVAFEAGSIGYSTEKGFSVGDIDSLSLNLPRCMIPGLGLQVELKNIKVDLSRDTNIAEAIADQRPPDFIGVYVGEAAIYLPDKWFRFDEDGSTLRLYGRQLIAGTGGFSGIIGAESIEGDEGKSELLPTQTLKDGRVLTVTAGANGICDTGDPVSISGSTAADGRYVLQKGSLIVEDGKLARYIPTDGELTFTLGKANGSSFWKIGFNEFYIKFWQNQIQESQISGSLTIPVFKNENSDEPLLIAISVFFAENGDFRITAAPEGGLVLCMGENGSIFKVSVLSLEAGKDDEKVYLQITGEIDFSGNSLLNSFITRPIEVQKLRIYSDGSFEIEGGSIPLPGSLHMKLGPVEVDITNLTLGAEILSDGTYKFFGFDCGISTGASGLDLRGDGIKFYFNHDGSKMFLRIAGIGVDLVIPGTANEETAALILKGYLSLKEHEYTGAVSFQLPKLKIAGGAGMKMRPDIPAFIVDAFMELPAPLPIGATGLGIYGFRGLFGLRYVANLPDGATNDPELLFDFYTEKVHNPVTNQEEKGIHLGKIVTPDNRPALAYSGTPLSIGAGVTIGTIGDNGYAFAMQAFLYLSLPELFIISGRGNILHERPGLTENEPPFFAYLAFSSQYVSIGMGADYKIKPEDGQFLDMHAEAKMAFFFNDSSAWYVHVGTKADPSKAKILKRIFNLDVYAYLMLSAAGIEAGAGVKFEKSKRYGPVSVSLVAYGDVYAMISFRKVQAGGGIACGGHISATVFGIGFTIGLDAYLVLTVPKPFLVQGGMDFTLSVSFWLWTWRKTISLEFRWEFNDEVNTSEINIIELNVNNALPVSAFHIGSGRTYPLSYYNSGLPHPVNDRIETLPLDSFIDIQLKKPVDPAPVAVKIGGRNNPPIGNYEIVPPKDVDRRVSHYFHIEDITIKVWKRSTSQWVTYNPYDALSPSAYLETLNDSDKKLGYWQKKGKEYNQLRLLSDSPFSYTDNLSGEFIPEQMGLTAGTLYCRGKDIQCNCNHWEKQKSFEAGRWHTHGSIVFHIHDLPGFVVPFTNVFDIPLSLCFENRDKLEILLPEKSLKASLKLYSYAKKLMVHFFDLRSVKVNEGGVMINRVRYELVSSIALSATEYVLPVEYEHPTQTIKKIVIEPLGYDKQAVNEISQQLEYWKYEILKGNDKAIKEVSKLEKQIVNSKTESCEVDGRSGQIRNAIKAMQAELSGAQAKLEKIRRQINADCPAAQEIFQLLQVLNKQASKELSESDLPISNKFSSKFLNLRDKSNADYQKKMDTLLATLQVAYEKANSKCKMLNQVASDLVSLIKKLTAQITLLNKQLSFPRLEKEDRCHTYVHEICYLTEQEWLYNETIPSQAAIEADYNGMRNAISNVIAPIWRPDETYAIEVNTNEVISGTPHQRKHYFAFRTAGPIGHFPLVHLPADAKDSFNLKQNGDPKFISPQFDNKLEIAETSLKFYLDMKRSYPNPSGNIINEKPLYYEQGRLQLFYTEPRVYNFFNDWPDYLGLGRRFASMVIEIKDPSEQAALNTAPTSVLPELPYGAMNFKLDESPLLLPSVQTVNVLRNPRIKDVNYNETKCWTIGGEPIVPASKYPEAELHNLLPSKLYTAVIILRYSKDGVQFTDKQIYSYNFQTSRYAGFDDHINSYILKEKDFNTENIITERRAVFNHKIDPATVPAIRDVAEGEDVVLNTREDLILRFPDRIERILLGYLVLPPFNAVLQTEFILFRDATNAVHLIYARSCEPFVDPRIPDSDAESNMKLLVNNRYRSAVFVFSRDRCSFLVFSNFGGGTTTSIRLKFNQLEWNGDEYISLHSCTTENLI